MAVQPRLILYSCFLCSERIWFYKAEHCCDKVNGIAFHPTHGTLATVGSDGRFSFWDKDARTKLKTSEQLDQPITCCCFNAHGNIFAYASSYDWSKASITVLWNSCTIFQAKLAVRPANMSTKSLLYVMYVYTI